MKYRTLFLIVGLFLSFVFLVHAEPKAYDLVKYSGKAAGITIAFDFADGYPEASELRITDGSGKTTKFQLNADGSGAMQFLPVRGAKSAIKSVSLNMTTEDRGLAKVGGSFLAGGKTVSFTLSKSRK